jgi:Flp pilus assembly protein TadD
MKRALLLALLLLSACKTDTLLGKPVDSMMGRRDAREARLATAANEAIENGRTAEALALYAEYYSHNKGDETIVVNYAQLLRSTGDTQRALEVISPLVRGAEGTRWENVSALARNEYAAILIARGDFAEAEKALNAVLEDQKAIAFHNDAWNLMGVALDAQGQHREAEQMFRQALDGWKGDPSSVMNNLGLCLASEGLFDEALTTLRKALVLAPKKSEIAKNVQIVSDLRDKVVRKPPGAEKPPAKKKKKKS